MSQEETLLPNNEAEESEEKRSLKERFKQLFSIQNVVRNIPFVLFLSVLAVLYIANNGRAVSLVSQIDKKNKELKELKWAYLDVQSRLISATSEDALSGQSQQLGLQPLEKPAFEIRDTTVIKEKK